MSEINELIAKSSLGGAAWCSTCKHPDALHTAPHLGTVCFGENSQCGCQRFVAMTPDEYLKWKNR